VKLEALSSEYLSVCSAVSFSSGSISVAVKDLEDAERQQSMIEPPLQIN
jgi:hypothetical protein